MASVLTTSQARHWETLGSLAGVGRRRQGHGGIAPRARVNATSSSSKQPWRGSRLLDHDHGLGDHRSPWLDGGPYTPSLDAAPQTRGGASSKRMTRHRGQHRTHHACSSPQPLYRQPLRPSGPPRPLSPASAGWERRATSSTGWSSPRCSASTAPPPRNLVHRVACHACAAPALRTSSRSRPRSGSRRGAPGSSPTDVPRTTRPAGPGTLARR